MTTETDIKEHSRYKSFLRDIANSMKFNDDLGLFTGRTDIIFGAANYIEELEKQLAEAGKESTPFDVIMFDIAKERDAQDAQWGGASHDDEHSVYDFAEYINKQLKRVRGVGFDERAAFVKIAALGVAAIEMVDRDAIKENQHEQ